MEDTGGSNIMTPVQSEVKQAQMKVINHLNKAYGIKVKKVNYLSFFSSCSTYFFSIIRIMYLALVVYRFDIASK